MPNQPLTPGDNQVDAGGDSGGEPEPLSDEELDRYRRELARYRNSGGVKNHWESRVFATIDALKEERDRYRKTLEWVRSYAHACQWTTVMEVALYALETPEETVKRISGASLGGQE